MSKSKNRFKMPTKRKDLEDMLVMAFMMGMTCGYGVEHTDLSNDERIYQDRYRAWLQGKIANMSEIIDNEKTYIERIAGVENDE